MAAVAHRLSVRPYFPAQEEGAAETIALTGHSGARLLLCRRGEKSVVSKAAGAAEKNERLRRQCAKQRYLSRCGVPFPRVLAEGTNNEAQAFFEMEYVPSRTAAAMLCEAVPFDLPQLLNALQRLFGFLRLTAGAALPEAAFHDKIAGIAACGSEPCRRHAAAIEAAAQRLHALDWSGIPHSLDHGDLTLENMLVAPGRGILFIDCDECFVSSWWLDAGKLFQDVSGHWCLRNLYLSETPGLALLNATERLGRLALVLRTAIAGMDAALARRLPQLAALHLFRTLPYSRDERLVAFVLQRISKVLCAMEG
jgi:tRNA A-37 threonylcarbamoyl transferase component Bud32